LLNKLKILPIFILCFSSLLLSSGCSILKHPGKTLEGITSPGKKQDRIEPVTPSDKPSKPPEVEPDPRMLASASLVDQGKEYLDNGHPDQALDVLERALSVCPENGMTYYYMAEAWVMKKNKRQALEFNRLAGMYLSEDRQWIKKVEDQRSRINSLP
jgi:hypothetical protein